jgi:hypothetical protein
MKAVCDQQLPDHLILFRGMKQPQGELMTHYDNDPRVTYRESLHGDSFEVDLGDNRPAVVEQCNGAWRAYWLYGAWPPASWLVESADSADEAIRELIGEPA